MYERVNPAHPDKQADRIAGALVDIAYSKKNNPKVAIEVLLGHGKCHIINETDTHLSKKEVKAVVSGIYILDVKGLHGKAAAAPQKKKGWFKRTLEKAQEKAGAKPIK